MKPFAPATIKRLLILLTVAASFNGAGFAAPADKKAPPKKAPLKTPYEWTFARAGDFQGWRPVSQLTNSAVTNGALTGLTTGDDPFFVGPPTQVRAGDFSFVVVRMRLQRPDGTPVFDQGVAQLFWTTSRVPGVNEAASLRFQTISDGAWHDYKLAVGKHGHWKDDITRLRLDPCGVADVQVSIEFVRLQE